MKMWRYNIDKDPEQGFCIQEEELMKYTKDGLYGSFNDSNDCAMLYE